VTVTPPRVLHVAKFYPPVEGGMETVVASLCNATEGRLRNRVLAYNQRLDTVHEEIGGVPVTRSAAVSAARSTPIAPGFLGSLLRDDSDLIVLHEPNPWALVSLAVTRPRAPIVIWFHSEVIRPRLQYTMFYQPLVRAVYSKASRFVVSSLSLAKHAAALRPYRDRVSIIPFGIDACDWADTPEVHARVSEIRAGARGRLVVLFTGRMVAYKGVDVLLRALVHVDAMAILAGEGPLRAQWQLLARELGLADRVVFPGEVSQSELRALYRAADVFVLPSVSSQEAFGFVQLEAMASGTPVISTRLPTGVPWVNQDERTGLTVPPGDVPALTAALNQLLGNPRMRAEMSAAAQARVASEFTRELMAERAASLFERLASGQGQLM
jgi:glycosyltransferase involved in cell wall biosynthesis